MCLAKKVKTTKKLHPKFYEKSSRTMPVIDGLTLAQAALSTNFTASLLLRNQTVLADKHERNLYSELFADYETLARPTANASLPVVITLSVSLQQLIDVDEQNQIVTVNAWLQYSWIDAQLVWAPEHYGGISDIRVPNGKIWRPDVLLYNSVGSNFDATYPTNFVVYSNGLINWIPPGIFKVACKIDIRWFPFDEQECFFKFGSWTYDKTRIDLQPDPQGFEVSEYISNGEWSLLEAKVNRSVRYYRCCPDQPYPDLKFYLHLRRRTLYFATSLLTPCLLILMMTIIGFTLPPEAGEKIALQITVMLSICIFLQLVGEMTPPTSETIPLLAVFFSCCLLVVSASVVSTVVVLNLQYRTSETYHMSNGLRTVLLHWLPWLMNMHRPGHNFSKSTLPPLFGGSANGYESVKDDKSGSTSTARVGLEQRINNCWRMLAAKAQQLNIQPYDTARLLMVQRIHAKLKYITTKMKEEEKNRFCEGEWRFAAMVVDRFCLIIFTVFIALSTLGIFGSAPYLVA